MTRAAEGKAEVRRSLFERALAGETLRDVHVERRRKDGSAGRRQLLVGGHARSRRIRCAGIVYALDDITEREKLDARRRSRTICSSSARRSCRRKNDQLDAAINNMSQGLAMFDAEQRLIVCNKLYAEMYGLTPEQVKPGTTVRQIFDYRMANGFYHVKDTEQFVDSWASSFGQRSVAHSGAGRRPHHQRVARQTADGGRVVTHEDITERQKLNAQLEQQHRLLKAQEEKLQAQNMQLDAALNNMVQGLAMFDADQRLVICQRPLRRDVRPDTRAGEAGHAPARDRRAPHRQRRSCRGKSADEVCNRCSRVSAATVQCQYTTRAGRRPLHRRCRPSRWPTAARSPRTRTSPSSGARRPRSCIWRCTTR